jgi:hypothetical protein
MPGSLQPGVVTQSTERQRERERTEREKGGRRETEMFETLEFLSQNNG